MIPMSYPARFRRDEDGRCVVQFVDLPEAITDGKDAPEAMVEAADCLGTALAFRIRDKKDIPPPADLKRGQRLVPVPLWIAGKVALYMTMREQGVSNVELARRLGVRETVVRRMLDPNRATRSDRIEAAMSELGKQLVLSAA
jgi:antitoxin HicB